MKLTVVIPCVLTIFCISEVSIISVSEAAGFRSSSTVSNLENITWSTCQYEVLTKYLHRLAAKYPTISRLFSIGKSVSGRDLWVMVISDHPIERPLLRPQVKFVGNIIGYSGPTCYVLLKLIVDLLEGFKQEDSFERRLVETNEIHILPNMNPDGFSKSVPGNCYGGPGRLNAAGIELNRDFPDRFNFQEGKMVQPETLAVINWSEENNFVSSLSFMSGKLVVTYPFDSVPLDVEREPGAHLTPDDDIFRHLATSYVRNVKIRPEEEPVSSTRSHTPYCPRLGMEFDNGIINGAKWESASGTMLDYSYDHGTFELMVGISCCRNENKTQKLEEIWEINKPAMLKMIAETDYGLRGQIIDAETHKPIPRASLIKTSLSHLQNENVDPMPWRSTDQGEFWRLILPGKYILKIWASGYEEKSVSFQITSNQFTRILVELEKVKKGETSNSSDNEIVQTTSKNLNTERNSGLIEVESSEVGKGLDSNMIDSETSNSVEPSYPISGKVNLIASSSTKHPFTALFSQLYCLAMINILLL